MTATISMAEFLRGPWMARPAILADLDGCLISGDTVLPKVPELIRACGGRMWIVSNNSTDTAIGLSQRLVTLGLQIPPERIALAGEETLRALAQERPCARVALFAARPLHDLAQELGLAIDVVSPDVVVLARDTSFSFAALTSLAALIHGGAELRITNPDPSHPGPDGIPLPETGALLAALSAIVAPQKVSCLGKPAPELIRKVLAQASVLPGAAVYIGDTPATDGAAARAAGVEFVQIAPPPEKRRAAGRVGRAAC